ncbi:hypothetical protein [Virgibacillus ihumii]|uniref:hypothetical protein n=1 Tax=Virgibacillus ihumii TaxID=2686091 RepID=UPI00157D5CB7|nr:hypothetical protein [Virgibacillus ihumii]
MQAINKYEEKKLVIHANYSEVHFIREALFSFQLRMESLDGPDSEEAIIVRELLHEIRNPEVEQSFKDRKEV